MLRPGRALMGSFRRKAWGRGLWAEALGAHGGA